MDSSIVIAKTGGTVSVVRSDEIAARVLQASMMNAKPVSAGTAVESSQAVKQADPSAQVSTTTAVAETSAVTATTETSTSTSMSPTSDLSDLRQKVADMTKALEALKQAAEALGKFMTLAMESDDPTALTFASQMLTDIRTDSAASDAAASEGTGEVIEGEVIEGEAVATDTTDGTVATDGTVTTDGTVATDGTAATAVTTDVTGAVTDGLAVATDDAVVEKVAFDNTMSMTEDDVSDMTGTNGNDDMSVSSTFAERINGGSGADNIYVEAKHAFITGGGAGDDTITINADVVRDVWDGNGNDRVSITGDKATELELGRGDDYYELNVGEAEVRMREFGGNDTLYIKDGGHLEIMMPTSEMYKDGEASATWDGNDLTMTFSSGDTLKIENAANAGSVTIRGGDMQTKLMDAGFMGADTVAEGKMIDQMV